MKITDLLNQLGWTVAKFRRESDINKQTAYNIANETMGQTSSVKLARKWLESLLSNNVVNFNRRKKFLEDHIKELESEIKDLRKLN